MSAVLAGIINSHYSFSSNLLACKNSSTNFVDRFTTSFDTLTFAKYSNCLETTQQFISLNSISITATTAVSNFLDLKVHSLSITQSNSLTVLIQYFP